MDSLISKISAKKIAVIGIMTTLSLIAFIIEGLLPPLFIPGAKAGFSNVFSMLILVLFGPVEAILSVIIRTVLGSVFTGNVSALLYSFSAGIISILVASFLVVFLINKLSLITISTVSAVIHNITQLVIYSIIIKSSVIYSVAPYLILCGIAAGILIGFIVEIIIRRISISTFGKLLKEKQNGGNQ